MSNETVNIGDRSRNHYTFYNALALLSHNNKDREFGTVIAESKNKLIIVDDEVIREHVYLIPKAKIDYYDDKQVYFNVLENSLKEFEM